MSAPLMEIAEPGMLTTVQDRGRYGFQRFGVPVSGAMDEFALRAANIMVGNDEGAAGLEMTVVGPHIRFLTDTWVAVTGADLSAMLDGEAVPRWQAVEARAGGELTLDDMRDGMRAYLAVAGGIDVPLVMGSRSTYVKASIGGVDGRALRKGDLISTVPGERDAGFVPRGLPEGYKAPAYGGRHRIRVIPGPQHEAFGPDGIDTLVGSRYNISLESDRMGYKLEGPTIEHRTGPDIVSDGNPPGAIQVPGDGTPTILMADRGTTGGYTKIATVISADLGTLAQAVPGQSITFATVSIEEAHELLREREATLTAIAEGGGAPASASSPVSVTVNGEAYEVLDEAGEVVSGPDRISGPSRTERVKARATVGGRTFEFDVEVEQEG
jgi:antagonist of KipI